MLLRSSQPFSLNNFPKSKLILSGRGPKKHFKTLVIGFSKQVRTLVTGDADIWIEKWAKITGNVFKDEAIKVFP